MAALEADSRRAGTTGGDARLRAAARRPVGRARAGHHDRRRATATSRPRGATSSSPTRPGHEQYTRNMVTGASTADCAVILLDARKGVLTPDAPALADIVSLLGIRHVVLAVNKMDLVELRRGALRRDRGRVRATFAARIGLPRRHAASRSRRWRATTSSSRSEQHALVRRADAARATSRRSRSTSSGWRPRRSGCRCSCVSRPELGLPRLRRHDRRRHACAPGDEIRVLPARHAAARVERDRHLRRRPRRGRRRPGGARSRWPTRSTPAAATCSPPPTTRRASPTSSRRPSCGWPTTRCTAGATT